MSESELLNRIAELEYQNHELITENKRLRQTLGLPLTETSQQQSLIPFPDIVEKENTVSITVITRSPETYRKDQQRIKECIEYLQTSVTVIQKPNIHQKYVIIDDRLVWYGSLNLMSYGSSEESMMRLESRELAAELYEVIR
jgi:phosphatidylserine/phosphatidylglycerophosphate/cardiolipin synthase-like enzyme